LGKAPDAKNSNGMHDLMFHYFMHRKIVGYDWEKNVYHDRASQAGFAQSFLEYIKYKILPQWNIVEQLLGADITKTNAQTYKAAQDGIKKLVGMFDRTAIYNFLTDHLRFPNMEITIIDFSNAKNKGLSIAPLIYFRTKLGIPLPPKKKQILA